VKTLPNLLRVLLAASLVASCAREGTGGGLGGIDDDFCHGLPDLTSCDDGSECTEEDRCGNGVCKGRSVEDGTECDDGKSLPGEAVCQAGVCVGPEENVIDLPDGFGGTDKGGEDVVGDEGSLGDEDPGMEEGDADAETPSCADLDTACATGVFDAELGECTSVPMEDGTVCDDGNPCTEGDACAGGGCSPGPALDDGAECDDGELCTEGDLCTGGICAGVAVDCRETAGGCRGVCDPATGGCVDEPLPDGSECNDRDACTTGESCAAGVCGGGENACFCRGKADGTPCDDGSACTVGDACAGDACTGTLVDCSDHDDACNEGACDPASGVCGAVPRAPGTPCEDGDACTTGDACELGRCAGAPVDCSSLDGPCVQGACDASTGECSEEPLADGLPCDDGNPCSGHDACAAGSCEGQADVCTPCTGKTAGDSCDDGDACTSGDTCAPLGVLVVCSGEMKSCAEHDAACVLGVCAPADGACSAVSRRDGTPCDDADSCTEPDACSSGACGGAPIDMCGVEVGVCEAPPQQTPAGGSPLDLEAGSLTVFGRISEEGETDWYAAELLYGHVITVETSHHCGSALDTLLAVYHADLEAPLAADDDGGEGRLSRVEALRIPEDGTYHVAVSARGSEAGSYLLVVSAERPPECAGDADCGCSELTCVSDGAHARCEPALPSEVEPNDHPGQATPIGADAPTFGVLERPGEEDYFSVELEAGAAVDVTTEGFCGEQTDTALSVLLPGTLEVLATDDDGGEHHLARIRRFVPTDSGTHLISVTSPTLHTGPYTLVVRDGRCRKDEDCGCEDQVCDLGGQEIGHCVPALHAEEPAAGAGPTPLAPDARLHAAVDAPFDEDSYLITLEPGTYDLETLDYCGLHLDTEIELQDALGNPLASDDNSGTAGLSRISAFEITSAAPHVLVVRARGALTGDYLVRVRAAAAQ